MAVQERQAHGNIVPSFHKFYPYE